MPTPASLRRFWPGLVGTGIALTFIAFVLAAPTIGGGSCMESYPMQCPVVEVAGNGLAATGVGLIACVLLLFFAGSSRSPRARISSVVAGFVALSIVVIVGANVALAHTVELRYY